jgi:uncharacterized membrane protein YdjX (TVP38/TMEM64 family)
MRKEKQICTRQGFSVGETMFWTLKPGTGSEVRRPVTRIGFHGLWDPDVNPDHSNEVPRRPGPTPHRLAARDGVPRAPESTRRRRRWLLLLAAFLVVTGMGAAFYLSELDWTDVHAALQRVPAAVAIALMALLPLSGFSVAIVYVVAGARFGVVGGGIVVMVVTCVHLVASNWIARSFMGGPLARYIARRNFPFPRVTAAAHAPVAAIAALLPGIPYFVRNYLLPLSGIPLRVYFWICLPIYVARSYVTILLGDLSDELSLRRVLVLGAVFALKVAICGLLLVRLRARVGPLLEPRLAANFGVGAGSHDPASQPSP